MKHLKRMNELFLPTNNISDAKKVFKKVIKPFWEKEFGEAKFDEWYKGKYEEGDNGVLYEFAKEELRNIIDGWKERNPDYTEMADMFGFEDENSDSFTNAVEAIAEKYEDRLIEYDGHAFLIPEPNVDYRDIDELKSLIQEYIDENEE